MTGQTSWRGDKNPKPVVPVDGSGNIVGGAQGLPTSTATLSAVASAATSAQALASTAARKGLIAYNTDANVCYLKYGTTASATSFTVAIPSNGYWEMPAPIYTGRIDVIWAADGSGSLYLTEL